MASHASIPSQRPAAPPGEGKASRSRLPGLLLALFALAFLASGIAPSYRQDWLLENVLVVVAVPVLVWLHRCLRFGNGTCLALFAFGLLHELGAHYTYAEVPYDAWLQSLVGGSPQSWFGLERNHYDRLVHFAYGLLVTPAAIVLIEARSNPQGAWRWLLPVAFITSHSALYELIEGLAAAVFGGDLGMAYLGTQGDIWDGQWDMAFALAGTLLSATWVLWRRARRRSADGLR